MIKLSIEEKLENITRKSKELHTDIVKTLKYVRRVDKSGAIKKSDSIKEPDRYGDSLMRILIKGLSKEEYDCSELHKYLHSLLTFYRYFKARPT